MDTIYALATAPGRSGVAVVRVSGPLAREACRQLAGDVPEPRRASLRRLHDDGVVLDQALVLVFPRGESFTGEDVVEFQTHGSPAVVSRLLTALSRRDGLRAAEAGEFTRRALENGRMSLSEVEGLADLLEAETEAQRVQAFRTFDGELGRQVSIWRADMVRAAALVEAGIDFADEEIPQDVRSEVEDILSRLVAEFRDEIRGVGAAERVRSGFEVAIVGPPNAGKSTLLNRLAGREAAITSEIAGTTRDIVEVRMDVDGLPVTFLDTAGLRETTDVVEAIGVGRALERANAADLRISLGDVADGLRMRPDDLVLVPKADLPGSSEGLRISGLTGEGVSDLLTHVSSVFGRRVGEAHLATRLRHGEMLSAAAGYLEEALSLLYRGEDRDELVAEAIRSGVRSMDGLVGRVGVEDVLGEIFSSFCIGK
ncbi:tRNA uridine-5-carboxymethylaminomethyl(34) synthesis GTPase MnmE [Tropicimonas sp. IMCC6043]|uniref:tRNA uridine-5-carboxymethylaminomethyl(34) synthesis GTPase MnmE n=1 Tax=Tropicimonas sp. IMCC6043 TaxID=2510645 RepID=UPI00101DD93C|nr:tRNA uridine-5-carboxymethylaminomethyl(34) synthesis GTPase MnmE [Tropicimonas sp. IMCC6043]RYH10870.1 tRNA uridine-5-carboxymethylaminomethyl(34) synthesis GTPase MnmE [Tropicimonas sp. IMCC6043]